MVEEFFELFKTPWELYRPGRVYDVVIATADEMPDINAKLLACLRRNAARILMHAVGIVARGTASACNPEQSRSFASYLQRIAHIRRRRQRDVVVQHTNSDTAGVWAGVLSSIPRSYGWDMTCSKRSDFSCRLGSLSSTHTFLHSISTSECLRNGS